MITKHLWGLSMNTQRDINRHMWLKNIAKLSIVITMCYLQVVWNNLGMPTYLQIVLWTIYTVQIFILSSRLFGIRLSSIFRYLNIIKFMTERDYEYRKKSKRDN